MFADRVPVKGRGTKEGGGGIEMSDAVEMLGLYLPEVLLQVMGLGTLRVLYRSRPLHVGLTLFTVTRL